MPLYDYRCEECHAVSEILVRLADLQSPPSCPGCGSTRMVRLISPVNFKVARRPAYSEEFIGKSLPFLKRQPETARYLAEGEGSEEARAVHVAERIGREIDRQLETHVFKKLGGR
ncbi:MAG TPA: FmdB family zinc ribbon protein [Candidatus Acidoferrales bacterium]|nr:FmdB family zinc ribbon protein [Candidatus Acidoferrales bacterium]